MSFLMEKAGDMVTFYRPREEYYFIKYGGEFGLVVMIIISLIKVLFFPVDAIPPVRLVFLVLFMIFLCLVIKIIFRRFVYRMSFNTNSGEVVFLLHRDKKPIITNRKNINKIHINLYITFFFEGKKVFYNEVANKDLVAFLETRLQIPITWGRLGPLIHKWW
jgi:hypothetical protein